MAADGPIETRTLFQRGDMKVVAQMHPDPDTDPDDRDFATPEDREDYLARHANDDFAFVGMVVEVVFADVVIATNSLWGIEHGTVGTGPDGAEVVADAWAYESTTTEDGPAGRVVHMGSPLASVVEEALDDAAVWERSFRDEAGVQARNAAFAWAAVRPPSEPRLPTQD